MNAGGIAIVRTVFRFWISAAVPEILAIKSLKWSKIDRNFACFWPPNFLGGAPPEFLEWGYKIQPDSNHVAKFQGDRSRELGERVAKQKKDTSAVKHKSVRNGCSGRSKNCSSVLEYRFAGGTLL